MSQAGIVKAAITDVRPSAHQANRGSLRGAQLLASSLEQCGLGRSILVSRDNQVIAGNHVLEQAIELGFDQLLIVESDGKSLVAVRRTDLEADSEQAILLSRFDNRTAEENLQWDADQLLRDLENGVQLELMFFGNELAAIFGNELATLSKESEALETLSKGDLPQPSRAIPPQEQPALVCKCPFCGESFKLETVERTDDAPDNGSGPG